MLGRTAERLSQDSPEGLLLLLQKLVNDARELDAESAVLQARIAGGRKEAAAALEVESKLAEALGRVQLTISGAESDIAHQCAKERDLEVSGKPCIFLHHLPSSVTRSIAARN